MSSGTEKRLAAYLQAESDILSGKRVTQITVDGETVRFTEADLDAVRRGVAEARNALKAEKSAGKSKYVYWGFGGRE